MTDRLDAFKLVAPKLAGAVPRPRLVAWLREVDAPAKWLSGPSGSGKSVLAAQYAQAVGKRLCWYRLDARDDDPAFFYDRLASAWPRAATSRRRAALPRINLEDVAEETAFAERFLAAATASLPAPCIFVFDDVHEVRSAARLRVLARLAADLPEGHEIVFVGQDDPPRECFDLVAQRRLALCTGASLAFDIDECAALAHKLRLKPGDADELEGLSAGHAAALVLACEFLRGHEHDIDKAGVAQRIHEHLLERLLERIAPDRRQLLLRTALAPRFDAALAIALAGEVAARSIESLVRQGLLRRQSSNGGDVFEAHATVRLGARACLRARDGDEGVRALALRTAELLEKQGLLDAAFGLLTEFGDLERATNVLQALAPRYAATAQAELLSRALAQLPDALVDRRPWLCFWAGRALAGIDEDRARGWFERSYAGFSAAHDAAGTRVAAASVVIAFMLEYSDIRTIETWLERHAAAGGERPVEPGSAHEATLCMGVICAALHRGAYPPTIDAVALTLRLQALLDEPTAWLNRDHAVEAARFVLDNARLIGTREEALALVVATERHVGGEEASALERGRWCISAANAHLACADRAAALRYVERARGLVALSGSRRLAFELARTEMHNVLTGGDADVAAERLASVERIALDAPPWQRAEYARLAASVKLRQHAYVEALRWADVALDDARKAGFQGAAARVFELERIYALAANGRLEEAAGLADAMAEQMQGRVHEFMRATADCLAFLAGGGSDLDLLRRALARAESTGDVFLLSRAGDCLARICDTALKHDVHPEFARRLIATSRVEPPAAAGPHWPWAVRVRTLGGFSLEVRGEPYRPARKAQDKPLELLKLLICCVAMRRTSTDKRWVAERLWPDADEANARKSLDMAIARLRRLLEDDDAIMAQESRLALAAKLVWIDIMPLFDALSRLSDLRDRRAGGQGVRWEDASGNIATLLEHYRGPFLPEDEGPPWLIAGREAITTAVRSTLLIAESLADGREPALTAALARAFDADPTSEDLARALMRALLRTNQHAEALRVYRRLREMLSVVLSVAPAQETEQLKSMIYAGAHAGAAPAASAAP